MNYIINPMWFYWLQVVNGVKTALAGSLVLLCVAMIVLSVVFLVNADMDGLDSELVQAVKKTLKKVILAFLLVAVAAVIIPSKETLIEMQIARYATAENASWTIEAIKAAVDYIVETVNSMK